MTIAIALVEYEIVKRNIAVIAALFLLTLALVSDVNAAVPVLALDPYLGDPPSMSGILSGSGWLCDSGLAPAGSATVSGVGVAGSATINRDGSLSGSFTVRGDAGQGIRVIVTSSESCPSARTQTNLQAYAIFTFNSPTPAPTQTTPTPTRTAPPTPEPTATPAPAVSPSGTEKPVMTSAQSTIKFIGCSPSAGKVQAKFDPVNAKPGTAAFTVPAVQVSGEAETFAMDLSQAQAGTVYKVLILTNESGCVSSPDGEPQAYWLGGRKLDITQVIAGKTNLWSNPSTITKGEMLNWTTEVTIEGYERAKKVPFRLTTELKATKAILQASYFPMPTDLSNNPISPSGLLATWDISQNCITNCVFTMDISNLLPPQPQTNKGWAQSGLDSIITLFEGLGNGIKNTVQFAGNMLQGRKKSAEMAEMPQVILTPPTSTSMRNYIKSKGAVVLPTTFYFRVVLLDKDGKPAGNPSNSVKISWSADATSSGPDFKLPDPPSPGKPYAKWDVEFLSYHGILRPKKSEGCFIVTENTKGAWTANHYHAPGDPSHVDSPSFIHQYYKDDIICQPDPPEGCGWGDPVSCIGDIAGFFEDAINWVSKVYDSAKNTAVGFVADGLGAIPGVSKICSDSCLEGGLSIGMDVALTSMGVPPNIPNFAELENQGLDYLAEQAVANSQIPQGALDAAKAVGVDPKEEIKKGIKKGLTETQKSYASSFSWLPEGVPVQPDGPQMPTVTLKVTRSKSDTPGECNGGSIYIDAYATMSGDFPGYKPYHPSYLPTDIKTLDITAGGTYRVFEPRSVSLPCAAPGSSLVIPVVLNPYSPHVGLNPPDKGYFWWLYPYSKSGELRVQATGSKEVKFNFVPNDPKW